MTTFEQELDNVIESAYQDMKGVMLNKKGYRLRKFELVEHLLKAHQADLNRIRGMNNEPPLTVNNIKLRAINQKQKEG